MLSGHSIAAAATNMLRVHTVCVSTDGCALGLPPSPSRPLGLVAACSHNPNPKAYKFPPPETPAVGTVVEGIASWYGPGYDGKRTSSGERFDQDALTAAHAYWAFGTRVRVTLPGHRQERRRARSTTASRRTRAARSTSRGARRRPSA